MSDLTSLLTGQPPPPGGRGIYLGTVTRLDAAGGVYAVVPRLATGVEFGPCPAAADTYTEGDTVLVAALEASAGEELIVLGRVGPVIGGGGDPGVHTHDDRYYTEAELAAILGGYSLTSHLHTGVYATAAHNHDAAYALIGHTHAGGSYVPLSRLVSAGLGLTGGGDLTADRTLAVDFAASGISSATKATRADDERLTNSRTPLLHAGTHGTIGMDPISPASIGAATTGHTHSSAPAHASQHAVGGSDVLTPAAIAAAAAARVLSAGLGLTGGGDLSADRTLTVDFAASGTSSATKATRADDSRLSNARTPTAHAASHAIGQPDAISPASIDAAATAHTHDTRYYVESEVDTLLLAKSDTAHTHDTRYYTETETNTLLAAKSDTSHSHGALAYARIISTGGQTIATSGTGTVVAFQSTPEETVSTFGDHVNNRLVIPTTGRYRIAANFAFVGNANGVRRMWVLINGSNTFGNMSPAQASATPLSASESLRLTAGDIITMTAFQNTGVDLNVQAGASLSAEQTA